MLLGDMAETVYNYLNTNLASYKAGFTLDSIVNLELKLTLDPASILENGTSGLYVSPVTVDFLPQESNRRDRIKQLKQRNMILLMFVIGFTEMKKGDVAPWTEAKQAVNFRHTVEKAIATATWSSVIADITTEPAVEAQLNQRLFMGLTEYTFEDIAC